MDKAAAARLWDLAPVEEDLIRMYCRGSAAPEELARWFSRVDFRAFCSETSCLAATISAANHYEGIPEDRIPALKGILKYIHTLNSGTVSSLLHLGRLLQAEAIPMILWKDTALHLGFPHFSPQHLWTAEAAIPEESYPRVLEIAEQAGFSLETVPGSALLRRGSAQQLVLYAHSEAFSIPSHPVSVQGVTFLLPETEALILQQTDILTDLWKQPRPSGRVVSCLVRIFCLCRENPHWQQLSDSAVRAGKAAQLRLVLEALSYLIPETPFPDTCFGNVLAPEALAEALIAWRELPPRGQRWKRLRLRILLETADCPEHFPSRFLKALLAAAGGRILGR